MKPTYYVFFDVDGTLTREKTMQNFLQFYYRHRYKRLAKIPYSLYLLKTQLQLACGKSREYLNQAYYRCYQNQPVDEIKEVGQIWGQYFNESPHAYNLNIVNELRMHQRNEAEIVFVSGSFDACLMPIADYLGVKKILSTSLEINNGHYTGKILLPQIIGYGKAEAIQQFFKHKDYANYKDCYAYGDHISDVPMLELVGNPIVVAGDKLLKQKAKKSNWKIINPQ